MSAWGGDPAQTQLHRSHLSRPGQTRSIKITLGRPGHSATPPLSSITRCCHQWPGSHVSRVSGPETLGFNYCCTIGATRSNIFLQLLVKHSAQHGLQGQETANKQTSFFFSAVFAACCPPPSIKRKERPGPGPDTRHQTPSDQELPAQPLITISRQTLVN